jgi:hypothetical protein
VRALLGRFRNESLAGHVPELKTEKRREEDRRGSEQQEAEVMKRHEWHQRNVHAFYVTRGGAGLCLAALLTVLAGCVQSRITVPSQDGTPPEVSLDLYFPGDRIFTVTSTGFNPALPTELNGSEEIPLVAGCIDRDGGCQNIQIFVDGVTTGIGSVTPIPVGRPLAENPDALAVAGGTALTNRVASARLNIPQLRGSSSGLRFEITARATNAHQAVANTRRLTLLWSPQGPLTASTCRVTIPQPDVLDSRELAVRLKDLRNNNPGSTTFTIAAILPRGGAFRVTVRAGGLPPDQAMFQIDNTSGQSLELLTLDGRTCAPGQTITAAPNSTTPFITTNSSTTTTLFHRRGGLDIATWTEVEFWLAFGGTTTTFDWIPGP